MLRISQALLVLALCSSVAGHALARGQARNSGLEIQIALDARNFSPGAIDGTLNASTIGALKAFQRANDLRETGKATPDVLKLLGVASADDALTEYEITEHDARGPFQPDIPQKLEAKAELDHLGYRSIKELLAEKFHMDERYLVRLNPKSRFAVGDRIKVANIARDPLPQVDRIDVDKGTKSVRAYSGDKLVASYPAAIGSDDKPSPSGERKVTGVAKNPSYTYDPQKLSFKGVDAAEKFTIRPGPNNPVGLVWIALNEPGYGIHGTPQPESIGKQRSHGCVRLTNWDALQLSAKVRKGVPVTFIEAGNAGHMSQRQSHAGAELRR